jgi:hypothetical protein
MDFDMSTNSSTIFVFGKGNKGRCGYLICDNDFKVMHENIEEDLLNKQGEMKAPALTDYDAIIKSLEYIRDHRGRQNIPLKPVVFLFTSFENTYHVCSTLKNVDRQKEHMIEFKNKVESLLKQLQRMPYDDNVKFLYIPNKFENRMLDLDENLSSSKQAYRP